MLPRLPLAHYVAGYGMVLNAWSSSLHLWSPGIAGVVTVPSLSAAKAGTHGFVRTRPALPTDPPI